MSSNNQEPKNIVAEPAFVYERTILTFNSFEEMNKTEAKAMAKIAGVNHLQNATSLIKRVYWQELQNPMNKKLSFK
jgi:hypothetical protein